MRNETNLEIKTTESYKQKLESRRLKFEEYLNLAEATQTYAFRLIALLFLVGVEIALIIAVFMEKPVSAGVVAAMTIIAVMPILVIRAFDISVLNLNKEGFQAELLRNEMEEVLSKVDLLFALTMSDSVFETLSLLNNNRFNEVFSEELENKLLYLENIGYIEFKSKVPLNKVADLRSHIEVTKTGKEFIELRSRVMLPEKVPSK